MLDELRAYVRRAVLLVGSVDRAGAHRVGKNLYRFQLCSELSIVSSPPLKAGVQRNCIIC
jgi:hypothetical protein